METEGLWIRFTRFCYPLRVQTGSCISLNHCKTPIFIIKRLNVHNDIVTWKQFSHHWPFMWEIYRLQVHNKRAVIRRRFDVSQTELNKESSCRDLWHREAHARHMHVLLSTIMLSVVNDTCIWNPFLNWNRFGLNTKMSPNIHSWLVSIQTNLACHDRETKGVDF